MTQMHPADWISPETRPQSKPRDYPGTIRRMRQRLGMTLAEAARGAGTTAGQVMKLEVGERRLTLEWLERLAKSFGCDILDLVAPAAMAEIAGYLTPNWSVEAQRPEARLPGEAHVTTVAVPRGIDPVSVIVLRRETASRSDLFAGATFFFDGDDEEVGAADLKRHEGAICLVTVQGGRRQVGRVQISPARRSLTLSGPAATMEITTPIIGCAPCLAIVPGDNGTRRLCGPDLG